MSLTIKEIRDRLEKEYDEVSILEILQIDSEELLLRFEDRIEYYYDQIIQILEEEEDD